MKLLPTLFAAALMQVAALASAEAGENLNAIKSAGVLKIGTEGTYAPFTYHDASGALVGFDVEIGQAVAEKLGVKAEFLEGKWDGLIAGLDANRYEICKLLWKLWSPNWKFDEPTYAKSAMSFDNPDFVPVVIQSYRHRYGYAAGDPALLDIETQLARQPKIAVPTICLHGEGDGVAPPESSAGHAKMFSGGYQRRTIPVAGHNLPQEAPLEWARAILDLLKR